MNDAVVALWSRLLASLPYSVLFLKANQLNELAVRQSVSTRFGNHGIDAACIILEGPDTREKYEVPLIITQPIASFGAVQAHQRASSTRAIAACIALVFAGRARRLILAVR